MLERFSGAEFLDRPTEHGGDAEIDDQRCGTEPGEGSEVSMVTTTRSATIAPRGVRTRVKTVLGCSFHTCCGRVLSV